MPVLKDLLEYSRDGEWGEAEAFDSSVYMHIIRGTDFNLVREGNMQFVPKRHIKASAASHKTLKPYDILFEMAGGTKNQPTGRSLLLKPGLFRQSSLPITCASFARFLRFDRIKADPEYMFWLLQHLYANQELLAYHTQHTGVARFQYTVFAETYQLKIPPLPIQRRIAGILSAYDALIEANTIRIEILEEMARRTYEEWFVHYRFPGGDGTRPEGWKKIEVRSLVKRHRSGTVYKRNDVGREGIVPVIDQSTDEVLGYHSNGADHRASSKEPLAIFGDHTCKMELMISDFSIGPNTIVFSCKSSYPIKFVYFLIQGLVETREYKRHWNDLMDKKVWLPEAELADQFDRLSEPFFQTVDLLKKQNTNLRAQRDLLLPRLVSGAIDVSEIGAEANSSHLDGVAA